MAVVAERPVYRPLLHPGVPNRWSRAAILEALRQWTAETGRAPRRQDWTGERPERAGEAQRKWMREHPRWPSSSRVAARFGTWSAALREAALPARDLTFPTTVAERVRRGARAGGRGARAGGDRRAARRLARERVQLPAGPRLPGLRAADDRPARLALPRVHAPRADRRARLDAVRRRWRRSAPGRRSAGARRATASGRPTARSPAAGRPSPRAGRAPRSSARCSATGTRRWTPPACCRACAAGTTRAVRVALSAFWAREGRAPKRADVSDPRWAGPSLQTLSPPLRRPRRRLGTLGPVP